MSLLNVFFPGFRRIVCPLCGGKKTYPVNGEVDYFTLTNELVARPKWLEAHGLGNTIPNPPDEPGMADFLREISIPPVVSRDGASQGGVHERCKDCDTLLPPEFRANVSVARDFAITVAGLVGHGKTSWLLAILSSSERADYEIVRRSPRLITKRYPFAEPYTVDVLERGFRSPMYYQLFGTTLVFDHELTFIRTLDIKGEMFEGRYVSRTEEAVIRHLDAGAGEGWLLVIDQYAGVAEKLARNDSGRLKSIGRAYEEISATMEMRGRNARIHEAIVWTFLDEARWNDHGARWLEANVPNAAPQLIGIGSTSGQPVSTLLPFYGFIDDMTALDEWELALRSGVSDSDTADALAALLFRLQLLYALRAGRATDAEGPISKFSYFEILGRRFVKRIQGIARLLYVADARSAMRDVVREESRDWTVFPCGRLDGNSVWSDQILLHALAESMK